MTGPGTRVPEEVDEASAVDILIIDDDPDDVYLIRRAFGRVHDITGPTTIETAVNGQDALDRLRARVSRNDALPDVIVLDLNMPLMDGPTFLRHMWDEAAFADVPVVVLTTADNPKLGTNFFLGRVLRVLAKTDTVAELDDLATQIVACARAESGQR